MGYTANDIRNICLLGHGGDGKSALCESMLFTTKAITRLGKRADGTTVSDFDDEEKKRQYSISSSVIPVEYSKCKINVIDNPGYFDFAGQIVQSLRVADAGLICLTAKSGIGVGTEKGWKYLAKANLPAMFYVSKLDEEHANYFGTVDSLRSTFGNTVIPFVFPILNGDAAVGVVDLLAKKAYDASGKEIALPADAEEKIEEYMMELNEQIAETSEELMEKFFETMELEEADIVEGLKAGMKDRSVVPVFASDAMTNVGTVAMLQGIADYCHAPVEKNDGVTGFVFKTVSDKFGKFSFVKVVSGKITAGMSLYNLRASSNDKLGRMYTMCGKKNTEVKEACCGDIVAIGKMEWKTGDTVCDPKNEVELPAIELAEPCYSMAISPKTKGQDDKVASGLARLNEEDISFTLVNNAETHQMVISGAGDIQVDVLCAKLKSRFGVETELKPARVAYREKIKGKVEAHGRHKKQSGGSGQFGDVWIRFEPQDESDDMIFEEEVFGGSVPKNFFPSVEKGLRNAVQKGVQSVTVNGAPIAGTLLPLAKAGENVEVVVTMG